MRDRTVTKWTQARWGSSPGWDSPDAKLRGVGVCHYGTDSSGHGGGYPDKPDKADITDMGSRGHVARRVVARDPAAASPAPGT